MSAYGSVRWECLDCPGGVLCCRSIDLAPVGSQPDQFVDGRRGALAQVRIVGSLAQVMHRCLAYLAQAFGALRFVHRGGKAAQDGAQDSRVGDQNSLEIHVDERGHGAGPQSSSLAKKG